MAKAGLFFASRQWKYLPDAVKRKLDLGDVAVAYESNCHIYGCEYAAVCETVKECVAEAGYTKSVKPVWQDVDGLTEVQNQLLEGLQEFWLVMGKNNFASALCPADVNRLTFIQWAQRSLGPVPNRGGKNNMSFSRQEIVGCIEDKVFGGQP